MAIPEGYTKLGLVGYSDKGTYTAEATYNRYNVVLYNGSTYVALKDGLTGVEPSDDKVNWKYFARGFEAEDAAEIEATDTYGVTDDEPTPAGGLTNKTILQTWLDKVADRIINKLVANDNFQTKLMEYIVNNGTANLAGFVMDARQGNPNIEGSLAKQISELNANMSELSLNDYLIQNRQVDDMDENELIYNGFYTVVGATANNPFNNTPHALFVCGNNSLYVTQIAIHFIDGAMKKRTCDSGTWGSWTQI